MVVLGVVCLAVLAAAPEEKMPKPQYDEKGQLLRPTDYREIETRPTLIVVKEHEKWQIVAFQNTKI